jgi:hypothetical protein
MGGSLSEEVILRKKRVSPHKNNGSCRKAFLLSSAARSMSKILITGVAGFIGSRTADQLLQAGHCVWGIDDLRTGRMANLKEPLANQRRDSGTLASE